MSLFERLQDKRFNLQERKVKKSFPSGSFDPANQEGKFVKNEAGKNLNQKKLNQEINKRLSASTTKGDQARSLYGTEGGSTEGSGGAATTTKPYKSPSKKKVKEIMDRSTLNKLKKGQMPSIESGSTKVTQSDVSKKAQDFTKKVNEKNPNRKEFKKFFDPEKAKESRKNLIAKRKEYGIDRKGNISDAGVERYAKKTKQLSSGSNIPAKITKADKDLAKKRAVGGEKIKNKSGKVIGTTTGKYGGKLSRARNKNMPSYDQVKADIDNKEFYKKVKKTKPTFTNRLRTNNPSSFSNLKPNANVKPNPFDKLLKNYQKNLEKNPEIGGINKVDKKLKKLKTVRSYGDPRDIVKTYKPAAAKKFGSKLVKGLSKLGPKGKAAAAVVGLGLGAYALTKAKFGKKKDGAGTGTTKTPKLNPPIKLDLGGE
tara:strand:+ start:25 stop:1302 length:1278 start_codon:yes stop_codon:yes gene_type:complete